jgi:hypothetical protein
MSDFTVDDVVEDWELNDNRAYILRNIFNANETDNVKLSIGFLTRAKEALSKEISKLKTESYESKGGLPW